MQHSSTSSRRGLLANLGAASAALALASVTAGAESTPQAPSRKPGQRSVANLRHPPMDKVRIGFIGLGGRGMSLLGNLLDVGNVEVRAICDIAPAKLEAAAKRIKSRSNIDPGRYSKNETDFENLCKRDDIDIVYIATPWDWHVPMCVAAMKNGKHAFTEVPAAVTLDECWQLVDTSEQTQRHCMMLENCCYGEIEMLVLNMVRQGVFGELTHGEAGYIHNAADYIMTNESSAVWRRRFWSKFDGNLYPTHGLGPVAQYMGIHRGDRFDHLVSMSSPQCMMSALRDKVPAGDPRRDEEFVCGDMNTTLIKTARGRSIMVQFDTSTPRPYSRVNMICGTGGTFRDYPPRIAVRGKSEKWEENLDPYIEKYTHSLWKQTKESAEKSGGHGGMDYVMNWRLIQCLREGLPLDMSVYDAAAWSSIFPVSVASVAQGSAPIAVPDFTRGGWEGSREYR